MSFHIVRITTLSIAIVVGTIVSTAQADGQLDGANLAKAASAKQYVAM